MPYGFDYNQTMPILKLSKHDPKKELEFDVRCHLELSVEQRLKMLWLLSLDTLKLAKLYAPRKALTIVKRT